MEDYTVLYAGDTLELNIRLGVDKSCYFKKSDLHAVVLECLRQFLKENLLEKGVYMADGEKKDER